MFKCNKMFYNINKINQLFNLIQKIIEIKSSLELGKLLDSSEIVSSLEVLKRLMNLL